jgi:hypothetical protein
VAHVADDRGQPVAIVLPFVYHEDTSHGGFLRHPRPGSHRSEW